jgi:hypothetical protein
MIPIDFERRMPSSMQPFWSCVFPNSRPFCFVCRRALVDQVIQPDDNDNYRNAADEQQSAPDTDKDFHAFFHGEYF